jgi:hypothetical protein
LKEFDYTRRDSQARAVEAVPVQEFDFAAYRDYEAKTLDFCKHFDGRDSGIAVYRRMRVAEVFADGCADMNRSLEWQLGGLQKSMEFKADIPNFIEPWYGIGTAASAFGVEYIWHENLAPAIKPVFPDAGTALQCNGIKSISDTAIGRHTLRMAEYFMEESSGMLPISLCDIQSPLNTSGNLVEVNGFLLDTMIHPEHVRQLFNLLADLIAEFTSEQLKILGDQVVWPGHGFASSRVFSGFGASDDNILLLTPESYRELAIPSLERMTADFGGAAFHSCGNWSRHCGLVKGIPGLKMVDGAFSPQTDPDFNPPEIIRDAFAGTGITLCARMVGDLETLKSTVSRLWHPELKLIAVTYCSTPQEQEQAYDYIHQFCV